MRAHDSTAAGLDELERDEFRRMETLGASVEEMIEAIFGEEVRGTGTRAYFGDGDDDDE